MTSILMYSVRPDEQEAIQAWAQANDIQVDTTDRDLGMKTVDMEQGTFPHSRCLEDTDEMQEERRLAYVGVTRAKRRLYLTRAAVRSQWGQVNEMLPSQFLDDIPDDLIDWKRRQAGNERMRAGWDLGDDEDEFGGFEDESDGRAFGHRSFGGFGSSFGSSRNGYERSRTSSQRSFGSSGHGSRNFSSRNGRVTTRRSTAGSSSTPQAGRVSAQPKSNGLSIQDFSLGDRVAHDQYGLGKVIDIQDKGHNSVLTVDFGSEGTKRLMLRLAPIEKL